MKIFTCRRQLMFVVCLLLGCLSMQAADDGLITEQVTLNGVLAGSLPTIITDDNKNLITNLKINGEINGTDLKFIREMAGRSVNGDETEGKLSILDLSDTKIVSGGKRYFHDMVNGASYFTKDDEIGDNAFYQCSGLKSLTLPDGITLIGEKAFLRCTGLTNITIPEGVTFIGMSAFIYCRNLTSITIPAGVTTISSFTFEGCTSLTNLTLPDGLTKIGAGIFQNCSSLMSLTIPSSITEVGSNAFDGCSSLNEVRYIIHDDLAAYVQRGHPDMDFKCPFRYYLNGKEITSLEIPTGVTSIKKNAFCGCSSLTNLTLPAGITEIGDKAFSCCSGLGSLTLPDGLTKIGVAAFAECSGLTNLTFPSSLTKIGDNAFYQCSGLKSLTFPNGLTEIGDGAFWECRNLTSLTLPSSLTSTGRYISSPFLHCNQLNDVRYIIYDDLATYVQKKHPKMHIPLDIIKYYLNDQEITSLEIPEGVTIIGENAFQKCSDLTSLTLPDGITSIGENAFLRCTGLTSLTFPSSLTKIGDNAFCECYGLKSLTLPDGITEINSYTFATCLNLTSLTLSANLTSISLGGFKGCFALKNLTIPSGLTSLSNLHITDISTTIESVYVSSSVPATAGSFFDGVDLSNCTLYVPKGMIWNYKLADVWKNFGKIIEYDTTGIDKVTTRSDVKEISRFSLDGQRLTAPTKGMNIVVYSDGSIKKVAVQ